MRSPAFTLEEFNQLVSATFDGIGPPDLVLAARPASTSPHPPPAVPEHPRPSALSLLRKVRSRVHDAVARHHADPDAHPVLALAPDPPSRARAKSLPRSFFNISPVAPDCDALPPVPPIPHSFFEEDSDSDVSISPPLNVRPRPSTPLGAFRRLSSLFESPPRSAHPDADHTRPMSPLHKATSVPLLSSPKRDLSATVTQIEPPSPSKPSLSNKLRTLTLSRSKLTLFSSSAPSPTTAAPPHPYSSSADPHSPSQSTPTLSLSPSATPITPGFPHPSSPAHHPSEIHEPRPITPEQDPFRKGIVGLEDSPSHTSPSRKRKVHKSRSTPGLFGIRSSIDSDRSHSHSAESHQPTHPVPVSVSKPYQLRPLYISSQTQAHKAPCASPLSFTFPLPPNSAPSQRVRGGLTVTVTTPPPAFPPPAFPPPRLPPPNTPLPSLPPAYGRAKPLPQIPVPASALREQLRAGLRGPRGRKDSKEGGLPLRSRSRRDSQREKESDGERMKMQMKRRGVLVREQAQGHLREKENVTRARPSSPFPLPLERQAMSGRERQKGRERVQELVVAAGLVEEEDEGEVKFTNPWAACGGADADVRPDSEVEPDYMRASLEAPKKASVASTLSSSTTSTARSDTTRTSVTSLTSFSGASIESGETRGTVMPPAPAREDEPAREDSGVLEAEPVSAVEAPSPHCIDASTRISDAPTRVQDTSTADTVRRQRDAYMRRLQLEAEEADADDEASPASVEGELLWMPGAFPYTRRVQAGAAYQSQGADHWHWHARRLSRLRLSIPVPLDGSDREADVGRSALGLEGVPMLGDGEGARSGWFE